MQSLLHPVARGAGIARHAQQPLQRLATGRVAGVVAPHPSSPSTPAPLLRQQQQQPARRADRARRMVTAAAATSSSNGNGNGGQAHEQQQQQQQQQHPSHPPAAETARTVMALAREGALATAACSDDEGPLSSPVGFGVTRDGMAYVTLPQDSPEARNLERNARCSVLLSPPALPARRVAAVALRGTATAAPDDDDASPSSSSSSSSCSSLPAPPPGARHYLLDVSSALYYGELDGTPPSGQVVAGAELAAAEPCHLRDAAPALVDAWNGDRAEDVYRVAAARLGVPLSRMLYAELLWVDRLGVYVQAEVAVEAGGGGGGAADGATASEPALVRVPFQRPVLDERDARSALTMAAQIAWESERSYVPPVPSIFSEGAVAAAVSAAEAAAAASN
jgi:hypothetical protein